MDEKDLFIKQKLQKDQLISKKADDVFNNFLKGDFKMEEEKNEKKEEKNVETKKKPMMKRLLATAASFVIVLGMANVYATTKGYGNVFFMIKYMVTGQNETITDKDEILSDRDISISYEPVRLTENIRMQIRNLQVKDNKAKLIIAVNEAEKEDSSVVPLNYKVYNSRNELICEQKSKKDKRDNEYTEELVLEKFKEDDNILILEVYKANNNKMAKITIDLKSRDITVEGEAEALKKVSEIELKKYLGVVSEYNGEPKGEEGKIKYAQAIFNEIKGESENNVDEINNMLESLGIEKVSNSFTQGEDYKKITKDGKSYYEIINGWDEWPYTVLDITDMSYCDGLYTATFTYIMMREEGSFDEDYSNIEKYEATVYFRLNDDNKYSKFKFMKYENQGNDYLDNNETKVEDDNQSEETESKQDDENRADEKTTYTYSSIKGMYKGTAKDNFETNKDRNYELSLYEDGTFSYINYVSFDSGVSGNYIVVDDNIILNYLFIVGNDPAMAATEGQKLLKINEDGTITDSKPVNSNSTKLVLKKTSDNNEYKEGVNYSDAYKNNFLYNKTNSDPDMSEFSSNKVEIPDSIYTKVKGIYEGTAKDKYETNNDVFYGLYLHENGTFAYTNAVHAESGVTGNYIIVGDTIYLNYLFATGSDAGLDLTEGKRELKINKDGSITDSNPDETNETNLILKKSSTNIKNEDYNLNYMINNFHISNDDSSKE